ncbi:MAG: VirB4 family type IV secretion/conjugal transfer ATPase, partial [Gammaproteobacteria bacterium CG_4_9_14_3_um_filter_38_9]
KKNAHIVIGTQSPNSVVSSSIRHVIMDNIATQIYFANPQAKSEDYIDGLKLTESEFEMIRKNTPDSRLFLLKQEHDSVICRLNLSIMLEVLSILSGNTKSVVLCDEIRSTVGDDSQKWIPEFLKKCGFSETKYV